MLKFSRSAGDKSPLAARKQHPDNLFTEAVEIALDFTESPPRPKARTCSSASPPCSRSTTPRPPRASRPSVKSSNRPSSCSSRSTRRWPMTSPAVLTPPPSTS
nr:GPO family capsid scaffolding protein [Halomonas elongata]